MVPMSLVLEGSLGCLHCISAQHSEQPCSHHMATLQRIEMFGRVQGPSSA